MCSALGTDHNECVTVDLTTAFPLVRARLRRPATRATAVVIVCAVVWRASAELLPVDVTAAGAFRPFWVPLGIATYLLFRWGIGYAPAVYLGVLAAYLPYARMPAGSSAGIAGLVGIAGGVAAAVVAATILRRAGVTTAMRRERDLVSLAAAALVAPLISAAVGAAAVTLATGTSGSAMVVLRTFYVWWAGDGIGLAVTLPLLFVLSDRVRVAAVLRGRLVEGVATAVAVGAVATLAAASSPAWLFVVIPAISWAAARFRYLGTVTAVALVAVAALATARNGVGAFAGARVSDGQHLQAFVAAAVLVGFLAAVVVGRYDRAEETNAQLQVANAELAALVTLLDTKRRHAAEVHDFALQHLFAVGLQLQSTARTSDPDTLAHHIQDSVAVLGDTIERLRDAIDDLNVDPARTSAAPQMYAVT